ncbi:hypothetical protein [Ekhidna sp.]|uniref:hypothetical protein n=1 Tax=Ekhidna sp. TaxID=2608089 RepID=UPI003BA85532
MKPTRTTCLFLIILLFSFYVEAQEEDETPTSETILKVEPPFRKGQLKWLNENGFETHLYTWDEAEVNLYLNKSLERRSTANIIGAVGGTILVMGLAANFMGSLAHDISNNDPDETYQVFKAPYYLGGTMIVASVGLSFDALSKLKKAKTARANKN